MEEDIITDLTVLQDGLEKMITRVEQRDVTLQHYRQFQETLFALNSLPEMIDAVVSHARLFFKLDVVSLVLLDEVSKTAGYLNDSGYAYQQNQNLLLLNDKTVISDELTRTTFIGAYDSTKHSSFFSALAENLTNVVIIPLSRHGEYLGSLNLASETEENLPDKVTLEFIAQIGFSVSICLENHLNFAIAQQAYRTEALANANNRRFLEQRLIEELEREQRGAHSISCIMLDVAFPAMKNHQETVQLEVLVLHTVAETVKRQLRVGDVFSYYEGKKFAAFLTNVSESVVIAIIERLKTAIAEQVINFANQIIPLTISVGFSSYSFDNNPDEKNHQQIALDMLTIADTTLYNSKHNRPTQNKKITAA